LEGKEIEEIEEVKEFGKDLMMEQGGGEATVWRVFTDYDTKDYRSC
jgi:hypothetical protein